jgi:hypothetical protein
MGFRTDLQKDLPQLDDSRCAMYDGYRGRRDITYESAHESSFHIWAGSALYVTGPRPRQEQGCILEARTGLGQGWALDAAQSPQTWPTIRGFQRPQIANAPDSQSTTHQPPAPQVIPRIPSTDNTANNHGNNGWPTGSHNANKNGGHGGGSRNMIGQLPEFGQKLESARRPFNERRPKERHY